MFAYIQFNDNSKDIIPISWFYTNRFNKNAKNLVYFNKNKKTPKPNWRDVRKYVDGNKDNYYHTVYFHGLTGKYDLEWKRFIFGYIYYQSD